MEFSKLIEPSPSSRDIHFFTAPGCSVCAGMKTLFLNMQKQQKLDRLKIIDLTQLQTIPAELDIKQVPWLTIGPWVFIGQMTLGEVQSWTQKKADNQGMEDYIKWQFRKGQLHAVEIATRLFPQVLTYMIPMMLDENTLLQTRIGIMAILESYENTETLKKLYPEIAAGMTHSDFRVRVDICQMLMMSDAESSKKDLQILSHDENPEVREAAKDALVELGEIPHYSSSQVH